MSGPRGELIEVEGLSWSGGAPMPVLIATDLRSLFACHTPTDDDSVVVGEFQRCVSVRFGLPNDEVVHGHPCGPDLMHYGVHIIHESPWVEELRRIESIHRQAAQHPIHRCLHYFLTFHDLSLEAVALGIAVHGTYPSMAEAVAEMVSIAELR